ncbi:MAG: hypothetical protein Q4F05_11335 [bacterium]|nr:hypothetical protein [bacterium]
MSNVTVEKNENGKFMFDKEEVRRKLQSGMKQVAIAAEYGVSQSTIGGFILDNNLKGVKPLPEECTEAGRKRIEQGVIYYQQGYSMFDAAVKANCSYKPLRNEIHRQKLARKKGISPRRSTTVRGKYPFEKEAAKAAEKRAKGLDVFNVCPICGKAFYMPSKQWGYKVNRAGNKKKFNVCTYTCMRKGEKGEF